MVKSTIDAGHGGIDPGATGLGYKEKDLALAMTLDVGKILEVHGMNTNYTRKDDRTLSLEDRVRISNEFNSDSFVSIHLNSFTDSKAHGLETFYNTGSKEGNKLANIVQSELVNQGLFTANRGVKVANFYVIKYTKAPAILIELCFIRNQKDMDLLINNFEKFAQAIAKAILFYHGIKYIPHTPSKPEYVKGKINTLLLSELVLADGFKKDDINYIKINDLYIPIRDIFESLGLTVGWHNGFVTADLSSDYKPDAENIETIFLGNRMNINGFKRNDVNVVKVKENYIPIRDVFKPFNLNVSWDEKHNNVIVEK